MFLGSTFDGNDINECAQNPNICQNGACENMIGTYRCICNPGFEVDETGKICTDINECEVEELVSDRLRTGGFLDYKNGLKGFLKSSLPSLSKEAFIFNLISLLLLKRENVKVCNIIF